MKHIIHHRRLPAIVVLLISIGVGAIYLRTWAKAGDAGPGGTLDELARAIASGKNDALTWLAYAQRLEESNRFDHAAQAYRKVLDLESRNRAAQAGCAIALAKSENEEELLSYMQSLTFSDAKKAMEVFEQPEIRPFLSQQRFSSLSREARAQAMD